MKRPLLHARFPELAGALPHLALGEAPTPVRPLPGISRGNAEIWLKDDGAYGSGRWGGNKVRKLEWIIADARRRGARTILTFGALGTNHGLATAVYAREHGLRTAIALVDQPVDDHVRRQLERLERSGAILHFTHTKARTTALAPVLMLRHASPRPPYLLPAGGSSPVGVLGYVEAALELAGQVQAGDLPEPGSVLVPVGSGGTAAGLLLGLRIAGLQTRLVGVVVNDKLRLDARVVSRLARRTARLLRRRGAELPSLELAASGLTLTPDWLGPGYGHPTPASERARELAGRREGLTLEPVYTAKTMAAVTGMDGVPGPRLYLHTHGPRE